jgi:uncharacterized protein (DUF983 family)
MKQTLHILWVGMRLVCPVCQRGAMFRSLFDMNEHCPNCGVVFERDAGEMTGGIAILFTVLLLFIGVAGGMLALMTTIHAAILILGLALFTTIIGVVLYRHARGLWVSFLFLSGAMFEE